MLYVKVSRQNYNISRVAENFFTELLLRKLLII